MKKSLRSLRADALKIFRQALKAVDPEKILSDHLSVKQEYSSGGKEKISSCPVRKNFRGRHGQGLGPHGRESGKNSRARGFTEDGSTSNTATGGNSRRIHIQEAGHPLPDAKGLEGSQEIVRLLKNLTEKDLVIFLISGGGSALLPLPVAGITLEEKQKVTQLLLRCGATIQEINTLRKHLSVLKGGGLAKLAYPATLISLILSDVIGDPLDVIASGPTVPDPTTFADCARILEKFNLWEEIPPAVAGIFAKG